MTQANLFAEQLIAGLDYREDFISREEEAGLIDRLQAMELAPFRFQGWTGNRKTQSYGWRYDFDDASFRPTEPIPHDPGAGIGWHKDRSVFDRVVGISLNSPETLRFRQRAGSGFRRFNLPVEPRSAYLLSGEARYEWEHRIVPGDQLRFSITFRTLSDLGRRKAAMLQRSS